MLIKIPFKTPTTNHLYYHKGNIKILKKDAREIRDKIINICSKLKHNFGEGLLRVNVWIHEQWYYKNGSICKKDIANREKFLIDSVFKGLGIDDKIIFEHHMFKVDDNQEFAEIQIDEI